MGNPGSLIDGWIDVMHKKYIFIISVVPNFVLNPVCVIRNPGESSWGCTRGDGTAKGRYTGLYPLVVLLTHQGASAVTLQVKYETTIRNKYILTDYCTSHTAKGLHCHPVSKKRNNLNNKYISQIVFILSHQGASTVTLQVKYETSIRNSLLWGNLD